MMNESKLESDSSTGSDDEWEEVEVEEPLMNAKCLFCSENFQSIENALHHCASVHKFDVQKLVPVLKLDCYLYIKLINYIRKNKVSPESINLTSDTSWKSDEYLKMELPDDPWILYGLESLAVDSLNPDSEHKNVSCCSGDSNKSSEKSVVQRQAELETNIKKLIAELSNRNTIIGALHKKFLKVRDVLRKVLSERGRAKNASHCVKSIPVSSDSSYFDSYADFTIHREMLTDSVRTSSYKNAITSNTEIMKGRVVLDLGCGTGILSMFSADAGASKVMGIDQSDILYNAMDIIRDNGFADKILLIKGRLEDTVLPIDKVDILVSEWMGYFLLFEAMLDSVVYARDNHLIEGGIIIPNRFTLELVGACDMDLYSNCISMWSNFYGYKMSCIQKDLLEQPLITIINSKSIITNASTILNLDMHTCSTDSINFTSNFKFEVNRDSELTCLVGYFNTFFDLPNPVEFSTGPDATPTHWKQTVFLLAKSLSVSKGQHLEGKLICRRHPTRIRSLIINISILDLNQEFVIS